MSLRKAIFGTILAAAILAGGVVVANDYRFIMVSHIGSNDPNMKWLTLSLEEFENRYPNVSTEYISTNNYLLSSGACASN